MTGVELVFETHSLTIDNEQGLATGWLGGALSDYGRAQAAELGRRRAGVDAVFASDLARSIETVEIAFGGTATPVFLDWRLREVDYGEWNGEPVETIDRERTSRIDAPFPGGESYHEAVERAASLLRDLAATRDGQRVLLIGHSATRWALDHLLGGVPLERLVAGPFDWREGWEYRLEPDTSRAGAPA